MFDDAPDPFQIRPRRVDLPLRFVSDAHVDQGDGPATTCSLLADLLVRNRGGDIAEQEPRLPLAEMQVAPLAVRMHGGRFAVESVHAGVTSPLCHKGLHLREEMVPAKPRV